MAPVHLVRVAAFSFCLASVRAADAAADTPAKTAAAAATAKKPAAAPAKKAAPACVDVANATAGSVGTSDTDKKCRVHTLWARDTGIDNFPKWYEKYNITSADNSFADFQCALHLMKGEGKVNGETHNCPVPCSSSITACKQLLSVPKLKNAAATEKVKKEGSLAPWIIKLILVMIVAVILAALLHCLYGGKSSKRTVKRKKNNTRSVKSTPTPPQRAPPPPPAVEPVAPSSAPLITSAPLLGAGMSSYMTHAQPAIATTTYLPAYSQGGSVAVTGGASSSMAGVYQQAQTYSSPVPMYSRAEARSVGGSVQAGVPMTYSPR